MRRKRPKTNTGAPHQRPQTAVPDSNPEPHRLYRLVGKLSVLLGTICVFSALLAAPAVLELWHDTDPDELADVRFPFIFAALAGGGALLSIGVLAHGKRARFFAQAGLFLASAVPVVMADRFLLLSHGLPLWRADPELHFRNRPSKFLRWPNGREIRTNRFGHHDHEFPEKPTPGELRILAVGDSVTFGEMVNRDEAFPNQLEHILAEREPDRPVQVINAGVQGYSTYQELVTMRRSLRFEPQIVVVTVCLNDFTEPFMVDRGLGGTGLDYHLVRQTGNVFFSYLLHETGIGRAALRAQWKNTTLALEKLLESQSAERFASRQRDDPEVAPNYDYVLTNLEQIYELGRESGVRVLLVLSPYTFQFGKESSLTPQRVLADHARKNGIEVLDLYGVFAARLRAGRENPYFQDANHFTPFGHRLVAAALAQGLEQGFGSGETPPSTTVL